MIENALVFVLGALAAGLLALVLFPAFTRRAARLARRDMEASMPRSLSEIAAARDGVKAAYAARLARADVEIADLRRALTEERAARSGDQGQIERAHSEAAAKANAVAEAEARTEAVRAELRARDEALARIGAERKDLESRLQSEIDGRRAAEARAEEAAAIATELRLALAAAEARAASLDEAAEPVAAPAASETPVVEATAIPAVQPPTADDAIAFGLSPSTAAEGQAGVPEDPAERARRVEDLAGRLKTLKRRNAKEKGRTASGKPPEGGAA